MSTNVNFKVKNGIDVAGQITSTLATGTAPLVIASTTLVDNLNANFFNGHQWSEVLTAETDTLATVTGRGDTTAVLSKFTNGIEALKVNKVTITTPATGATLTLGDGSSLITAGGAYAITLNATAATSITLPTSGTLATTSNKISDLASCTSAELAGKISDETGTGLLVFATSPVLTTPTLGVATATSINKVTITAPTTNATLTLAQGSTLATSGAFSITLTSTAATNVTLPTTGTLTTTSNKISDFAACTSAELAGKISDETGTGVLVFATSPTFVTSVITSSATLAVFNTVATTVNAFGAATALSIAAGTGTTTINNNLTVGGNLIVNGTTTTVNSTTVTIDDPIFTLGGDTAPATDDAKDRGIEFRWHNGTVAKVGFFGFDDSTGYFSFRPDATNASEVFSGTLGDMEATNFHGNLVGNADSATTAGKSTNLVGGNSTTLLGSIPYQSNVDVTTLLAPNTTTTRKFLRQTGTGTNGAAPVWDTVVPADIGATTVGSNLITLANPSAITFVRINADNSVSTLDASSFRTAIGAGVGTVTSVGLSLPAIFTVSGTPVTGSGTLTGALATQSGATVFAGPVANTAAPSAVAPAFRNLELTDIPGSSFKKSVRVATTAALTLNAATASIDGITLAASDRVLIKNQATASQNGIYYDVTTTLWKRTVDADASSEISSAIVCVDEGSLNGGKIFTNVFKPTDTLGTTNMVWYEMMSSQTAQPLDGDLTAIAALAGTSGYLKKTAVDTWTLDTTSTGTGNLVFSTSPVLVTPSLGVATGTSFNSITGLASALPLVDGTATVGISTKAAREDHIHPSNTLKADLASPTFTGVPLAPTATAGTNTQQIATTAFVAAAVATSTLANGVIDSATITTASVTQTAVDTFPVATFRSVAFEIQVSSGANYTRLILIAIHDGTNVSVTEFGNVVIGSALGTFDCDINTGNLRLLFTAASAASTTVKVISTAINV